MKANFILIFLFFLMQMSCTSTMNKKEILIRKWRVESIEVIPTVQDTAQPTINTDDNNPKKYKIWYEFKSNGVYICQRGSMADSGKWEISTNEKVLLLKSFHHNKDDADCLIEELNRYLIVLSTQERGKKEILKLTPDN